MPRKCSVCARSDRGLIEAAVDNGGSFRDVGRRFSVALGSLDRHTQHARLAVERDEDLRQDLTSFEANKERVAQAKAWKAELEREAEETRGNFRRFLEASAGQPLRRHVCRSST